MRRFYNAQVDSSLFVCQKSHHTTYVIIYVDNIIVKCEIFVHLLIMFVINESERTLENYPISLDLRHTKPHKVQHNHIMKICN